jgi:hypothetical protein
MAAIIQQLQQDVEADETCLVQHFFCNASDDATSKSARILDHLLFDLYQRCEASLELLEEANKIASRYTKQKMSSSAQEQPGSQKDALDFGSAYRGIAKLLGKKIFLVVDALDECSDRKEQDLLKSIRSVNEKSEAVIKLLFCSRPNDDVEKSLAGCPQIKVEGNNGPDIRQNATTLLQKLPNWTSPEREMACDAIVHKAGSYFRYVELAINFLKLPWQRPLSNRLKDLPDGLNNSYRKILQQTDPNYLGLLETCLTWTILAEGDITVSEVIDAFSKPYSNDPANELSAETDEIDDENDNCDLFMSQIRFAGSSFLQVDDKWKVISLRHNTVADYFLKVEEPTTSVSHELEDDGHYCARCRNEHLLTEPFVVTRKHGHLEIAKTIRESILHLRDSGLIL